MIIASAIFKEKVIYIGKRHNNIINSHEKGFFNKIAFKVFLQMMETS
ncbi:MAG: hypothetical protein IJF92_00380 [Bacilli bacterium]|nr:hypothetical protein [Bacilli bacterium]MBQ3307556.1 hypothetical protein [Bacilli bacterium]